MTPPIINLTNIPGWSYYNITPADCSNAYLKAYDAVREQLGTYIIFFAIAIVFQALLFRLWDRQKVSDKRFKWAMTIITGLELFWVFNLIGLYLLQV